MVQLGAGLESEPLALGRLCKEALMLRQRVFLESGQDKDGAQAGNKAPTQGSDMQPMIHRGGLEC